MAVFKCQTCGNYLEAPNGIAVVDCVYCGTRQAVPNYTMNISENVAAGGGNTVSLLKRAFMFLEDGEWANAYSYCEKVLDIDPECAQAYLGKLLAELHLRSMAELQDQQIPFDQNGNFVKLMRFADESLKSTLNGYIDSINVRNEQNRFESTYNYALSLMNNSKGENDYKTAAEAFKGISGYKDADSLAVLAIEYAETARKDTIHAMGMAKLNAKGMASYQEAKALFSSISGWKDADEQIEACQRKIEECIARKKRIKKRITVFSSIFCVVWIALFVFNVYFFPSQYNKAIWHIGDGEYREALEIFLELGDYKDSEEYRSRFNVIYDKKTRFEDGKLTDIYEYTYDSDGKLMSLVNKDADGKIEYSLEYSYDSDGNRMKYKYPDGKIEYSYECKYDSDGNMLKEVYRDADGKIEYSLEYSYDSDGNRIKYVKKDADGKIEYSYEYKYDSDGNRIKYVEKDADGKIENSAEYSYDSDGNVLKEVHRDADGKIENSAEYSYDSDGNMLKEVYRDADGKVKSSCEYSYSSDGNFIKEVRKDADGKITGYSETTYTKLANGGKNQKSVSKDADGNITSSSEDEYDSVGNQLKYENKYFDKNGKVSYKHSYEYKYEGVRVLYYED